MLSTATGHFIPIPEHGAAHQARQKKLHVLTSVHMSVLLSIVIGLVSTMASFTDLVKFVHSSRQATLKYQTHLFVLVPLVIAFCCQPSFIMRAMVDKKHKRARMHE